MKNVVEDLYFLLEEVVQFSSRMFLLPARALDVISFTVHNVDAYFQKKSTFILFFRFDTVCKYLLNLS